jgi:phosphoglycolate phosphatase-like HAD superfamily hydrolase
MIKNIFFDFDGVLAESVNMKTEAFRNLYLPFGKEISDKVVEHHLANGGVSRFDKIRKYHAEFLNSPLTDSEVLEWADKFSELVLKGVITAPEVTGATEFLENYSQKYACWVITGTPTTEIEVILEERKMSHFFKGAFGSPEKKNHWTEFLLDTYNLKREETVFIGDATTDQDAASFSNLHFVLRRNEDNKHLFLDYKGHELENLSNLESILKSI